MPKIDVMVARFPGGASDHPATTDYLIKLERQCARQKVAGCTVNLSHFRIDDTPITMGRNRAVQQAIASDVNYLLMIDSDMAPDLYLNTGDIWARPFFDTSLEFMLDHKGPSVVGAPYCGPPPHENVYVFCWQNYESNKAQPGKKLDQYSREHAAIMHGIQVCGALPTGLILMDVRCLRKHPFPHFYYEWEGDKIGCDKCHRPKPGPRMAKASTEDVTFTRDLSMLGTPIYCNWDAWAGHFKLMCVGKPEILTANDVGSVYADAIRKGVKVDDRMQFIGDPSELPTAAEIAEARAMSKAFHDSFRVDNPNEKAETNSPCEQVMRDAERMKGQHLPVGNPHFWGVGNGYITGTTAPPVKPVVISSTDHVREGAD